jgi:hypothetical protein
VGDGSGVDEDSIAGFAIAVGEEREVVGAGSTAPSGEDAEAGVDVSEGDIDAAGIVVRLARRN